MILKKPAIESNVQSHRRQGKQVTAFLFVVIAACLAGCATTSKTLSMETIMGPISQDLQSVDLLNPPPEVDTMKVRQFFTLMGRASSLPQFKNIARIKLTPSLDNRWMAIRYQKRSVTGNTEDIVWSVEGQIISADRLDPADTVRFQPRWISNTAVFSGSAMTETAQIEGWKALSQDLLTLAADVAKKIGLQDYIPATK